MKVQTVKARKRHLVCGRDRKYSFCMTGGSNIESIAILFTESIEVTCNICRKKIAKSALAACDKHEFEKDPDSLLILSDFLQDDSRGCVDLRTRRLVLIYRDFILAGIL